MDTQKLIVDKIASVLEATNKDHADHLKKLIDGAGRIFVSGAGRSLLVARFFAMRLVHTGYQGHSSVVVGDEGRRPSCSISPIRPFNALYFSYR